MAEKKNQHLTNIIYAIILLYVVYLADYLLPIDLKSWGIVPRNFVGLRGILFAPFLHASLPHLISNTIPLFTLLLVLFSFFRKAAGEVVLLSIIFSGALTWLFARGEAVHLGASGLIYAIAGFLIAFGLIKRNFKSIVISLAIVLMYGGLVFGLLPTQPHVSWEGHLFGAISGVFIAYLTRRYNVEA